MDDYLKKQTLDKLSKANNILISVSQSSGFDGLASGLAIYLSLKKIAKMVSIKATDPTVGDAQSLYAVDKIGKSSLQKDLVISINNAVENVDKVTYFLEGDQLKIVVHSFPDSNGVSSDDVVFDKTAAKADLIIALAYNSLNLLKQDITHEHNIDPNIWILSINIDSMSQKFAQVNIHEHNAICLSEVTTDLLKELALPINEDISFNLYSGIKYSTNMFSPNMTKPSTLEAAQYLLTFGAGKASLAASRQINPVNHKNDFNIQSIKSTQVNQSNHQYSVPKTKTSLYQINQRLINKAIEEKLTTGKNINNHPIYDERSETPIEEVERKEKSRESWLKPPKIYRGSKSFDRES
ncbi:hypothetical protein A2164_02460 [Candidatus Curtissbacteria bacterium RBG_13_35_7]|uniref:DDH domain-containing protein n=1 Tax=Candidatus Curtissbacteria bacterium RBG_13_35_7 TaxID=1797705 RepID=A0A1F5G182_9BACT|nr:MAG: hypothetical protein A2164_02460 [Candidatus Curtissbacteria bacterium RBG_13_35_7]